MNSDTPKIIIIVPVYNEAKVLDRTLKDLTSYFNFSNIVVVDDGSTDETSFIASQNQVVLLKHFINRGAGAATKTGLIYAFDKLKADIAVTFDADGQHDHNDILNLINPIIEKRADIVIGSRFLNQQQIPWIRRLANFMANFFTFLFFGLWVSDSQSGFKALSRTAWNKINFHGDRFEFCSEIVAEIKRNGLKYKEIPIKVYYSQYSRSKGQGFIIGLKTLVRLIINHWSK